MMKFNHAVFFFFLLPAFICEAQSLKPNREKVMKAQAELRGDIGSFQICLNESDLQPCMTTLIAKADNPYKKYLAGGILFSIDPGKSLQLHKEAYEADRKDANFALEYALELHRARKYAEAIPLYLAYQESNPDDFRLSVWLSDCYLNTGAVDKSIEYWRMSNHPSNHTGIDFAIHIIYGETNQVSRRDRYRKEINNGNLKAFYPLIFLDLNWAYDWWNAETLDPFLQADLALMKTKLVPNSPDYKSIEAYRLVKRLSRSGVEKDSIRLTLKNSNVLLEDAPFLYSGQMTSDLLSICFEREIIDKKVFYEKRGAELLQRARETKDKDFLNIYAHLQAEVKGKVDPDIDKMGWKEFKDERFAVSYFIGKGAENRFNDTELAEAINDFPNAPTLRWVKANCAKLEKLPLEAPLVELVKCEFRTLGSHQGRYSYALKGYFAMLTENKD